MSSDQGGKHSHEHSHSGGHDHQGETGALSERDKLRKMIEHWIEHNLEHANSFEQWAGRADTLGETEVAALLRQAAADMNRLNRNFDHAISHLAAE
ncbi:MAG: hypothetical protein AUK55_15155 [Syntrophobacteraceae bacterium CG2_30_61_12]|nr:MAG: hypothetical protein AUK55_15155 [Syntrophobacteraceae bacterium CG2_30_61_12]